MFPNLVTLLRHASNEAIAAAVATPDGPVVISAYLGAHRRTVIVHDEHTTLAYTGGA